MNNLFDPLQFRAGISMKNRFMLAPLTNTQSNEDGTLSDDEYTWLTMRAKGGFGLTMTCASHVQEDGKGFGGQLGIFSDSHIAGHTRLAAAIKQEDSLAVVQLHHAGIRSPKELLGKFPVGPSAHEKTGARALVAEEVYQLRDDFIAAAVRAQRSGYDGVEIHGAHGYILCQFLSAQYNHRTDEYGGSLENRARLILEIIAGIRQQCGIAFLLGIRLSPERFGMQLTEIRTLCQQLVASEKLDFIDLSLWDVFKEPEDNSAKGQSLLEYFNDIDFGKTKLTVAGKIYSAVDARRVMNAGVDFVTIGRAAILHHDFPQQVRNNSMFKMKSLPVSVDYLKNEGVAKDFIEYLKNWPGFVQ